MKPKIEIKLRISSIEESKKVQDKAFSMGYFWHAYRDIFLYRNETSLFLFVGMLNGYKIITFANKEEVFNSSIKKEVSIEEFLNF